MVQESGIFMNPVKQFRCAAAVLLGLAALAVWILSSTPISFAQQATTCVNAPIAADPSPTVCISGITVPFNGNSPDNQFYVSWRSQKAEKGQVKLSDGEIFEDVRGATSATKTHYVLVNNLDAKSNVEFDILSGGSTFTNSGAHWSVHLGPALQPATPYTVFGRVQNPDGSDADGTVVLAQVRDGDNLGTQGRSAYLSGIIVLADGGNFFNINLADARTQNSNQKYDFDPAADRVQIIAMGAQGTVSKTFAISDLHPPKAPPSLILGGNGSGNVVTATPTLIPPTATPTLTPSPTASPTPAVPTATLLPPPTETVEFSPTEPLPTETVFENPVPTLAPAEATLIAENTESTPIVPPGGEVAVPERTRVSRGVPELVPPPAPANNTALFIGIAVVLFVGAMLLGLAAYFVSRR
jgi:hypothetical protein